MTRVSYLIVAYRSRDVIVKLLNSIAAQSGEFEREIIVVDNSAAENCADLVQGFAGVKYILNSTNSGYTKGMNQAIAASSGEYQFWLNPDVVLADDCTTSLLAELTTASTAAAAPQLQYSDGTIQSSVRNLPTFMTPVHESLGLSRLFPLSRRFGRWRNRYFDHNTRSKIEQPMASAFMIKSDLVKKLGPMDEEFFVFFSDVDYCKRIVDAGLDIMFIPDAKALHVVGGSTRQEGTWLIKDSHRGFYRYLVKHELKGIKTLLRPFAAFILCGSAVMRIVYRKVMRQSF